MARLKQGLLTVSDAYLQLAERTQLVFRAHRDIVSELPDIDAEHLHTAKFTGTDRRSRQGREGDVSASCETCAGLGAARDRRVVVLSLESDMRRFITPGRAIFGV